MTSNGLPFFCKVNCCMTECVLCSLYLLSVIILITSTSDFIFQMNVDILYGLIQFIINLSNLLFTSRNFIIALIDVIAISSNMCGMFRTLINRVLNFDFCRDKYLSSDSITGNKARSFSSNNIQSSCLLGSQFIGI